MEEYMEEVEEEEEEEEEELPGTPPQSWAGSPYTPRSSSCRLLTAAEDSATLHLCIQASASHRSGQ